MIPPGKGEPASRKRASHGYTVSGSLTARLLPVDCLPSLRQPAASHAAWRIAERSAAQAHGMSSSMREAGQRLTSLVSTSVK